VRLIPLLWGRLFIILLRGIEDSAEYSSAMIFFVAYADDHPAFREYISLPGLVSRLKRLYSDNPHITPLSPKREASNWLCHAITRVSEFGWATLLLDFDLCNFLVRLLL
jgi:hypothetical protein